MIKILKKILRWILKLAIWFLVLSVLWVLVYKWVNPPITFLQAREYFRAPDGDDFHKEWVDIEEIALPMRLAVVASEDQNFKRHSGFDFGAIQKAIEYNEKHKKTRGASTISQQTAKNVFLWPGRNWVRKGLEVYFTFLIELLWSKERILEVYLNVIETGKYKFGVEAAAQDYFRTSAAKLSKSQAALIAAAVPSPRKSNPGAPSAYLSRRKDHILRQMRLIGSNYFEREE
ncbi:monofunctional biosynthetic peptidoglycan transglycosylase [Halocola ammonii]